VHRDVTIKNACDRTVLDAFSQNMSSHVKHEIDALLEGIKQKNTESEAQSQKTLASTKFIAQFDTGTDPITACFTERFNGTATRLVHGNACDGEDTASVLPDQPERVCRKWEEAFLHMPTGKERSCVNYMTNTCVASEMFRSVTCPTFHLCEFLRPSQFKTAPSENSECLLCQRQNAASQLWTARALGQGMLPLVRLTTHSNIVGVEEEYCVSHVNVSTPTCFEGLTEPVVRCCKRDYEPLKRNGVWWLHQNMPTPTVQPQQNAPPPPPPPPTGNGNGNGTGVADANKYFF
jgi:hypothetical protein